MNQHVADIRSSDFDIRYDAPCGRPAMAFADDPERLRRHVRAIGAAGARIVAQGDIAAAGAHCDRPGALLLIDVSSDGGDLLDALLARIDAAACVGAIVVTTLAMLDIVAARITDAATILVEPSDEDVAAAAARLLAPVEAMVGEPKDEDHRRRLGELSEEVGRIARTLAQLSASAPAGDDAEPAPAEPSRKAPVEAPSSDLTVVRTLLRLRQLRGQFLDTGLFADPAWDMLLDLAAARLERRRVAVSSLCIAAAVPPTTALRWITTMTEMGLFTRYPDPDDGRRVFVTLSETATEAMTAYVQAARRALAPIG